MCLDPVTAATIGSFFSANATTISLLSAGANAVGQYQQSAAQKSAAKYSAAVANANAKVAEFKAQDALDRGQRDAEEVGRRQAGIRGQQKAGMAKAGLDLSSGTPGSILDSTDYYGLQDQATSVNNAGKEAFGHRAQGASATAEAEAQTARARSISPFGDAATSLLGSATKLSSKWYDKQPTPGSRSAWGPI